MATDKQIKEALHHLDFLASMTGVHPRRIAKIRAIVAAAERWARANLKEVQADTMKRVAEAQAAALAAKEAEISTLKSDLKCETDRYAALVASDSETLTALVERIATLEAALRHVEEALVRDSRTAPVIEFIRAALSGKEPQQP